MAGNPACERFVPLLSPYIDGELSPSERVHVERHLSACRDCTSRTADLRAESGLLRVGLDMAVDEVDFKDFAQKVMARVTPEKPPVLERLRLTLSEMFLYQRTAMISSLATAAVLMLIALPLLLRERAPVGYAAERMTVQAVRIHDEARVAPVVMETDNGGSIIWLVDEAEHDATPADLAPDAQRQDQDAKDALKPEPQRPGLGAPQPKGGDL